MTLEELKTKVDKLKTAYYESNHGVTDPNLELLLNYIAELEKELKADEAFNVKSRSRVLFHEGNTPEDTRGIITFKYKE